MTSLDMTNRIDAALDRIRSGIAAAGAVPKDGALQALSEENASLQGQLSELKTQRDNDLAELDGLVAQLKPLIGEA